MASRHPSRPGPHGTTRGDDTDLDRLLNHLEHLDERGGGYELRGVRGWCTPAEAGEATGVWNPGAQLRRAVARGLADQADVRLPGAERPFYVYRITADGSAAQRARGKDPPRSVRSPKPSEPHPVSHLTPGAAAAMDALRGAEKGAGKREWVPGEPEWRTSLELTAWLVEESERTGVARVFFADELARLVHRELAERREHAPALYRLTPLGRSLRILTRR